MNNQSDSQTFAQHYDSHITPAESAARQQREGKRFGHTPDDQADSESIHTTAGYTNSLNIGYR